MRDAPAFDFFPERWLCGVATLTDAEQLSFLRLLCHQWMLDGLPESIKKLRRLAGRGVTQNLLGKFPMDSEGIRRNPRLESVRNDQRLRIAKSLDKIAKMNAARDSCRGSTREPTREPCRPPTKPPSPITSKIASQSRGLPAPSLEEWTEFGKTLTPPFPASESERAWNHYESNGWRVGKNPVKKWQACCRKCHLNWKSQSYSPNGKSNSEIPRNQRDPIYDKAPEIRAVPESERPDMSDFESLKNSL